MDNSVPGKGKAIGALVLGIVSVAIAWFGWGALFGLVCGIVGIILAVGAKKEMPPQQAGMATAGMVLSIIGVVLSGIMFISFIACLGTAASMGLFF